MERVQVWLTEAQTAFLRERAKAEGSSVSELVRRAVDALYLTELPPTSLPALVSDGEDG